LPNLIHLGIQLSSGTKLNTILRLWCDDTIYCGIIRHPSTTIKLHSNGIYWIDTPNTSRGRGVERIKNTLLHPVFSDTTDHLYLPGIAVAWELGIAHKKVEITFKAIIKAYILAYTELSKKYLGKSKLCDLDKDDILFLKRKLPFEVYLWNWDYRYQVPKIPDEIEQKVSR